MRLSADQFDSQAHRRTGRGDWGAAAPAPPKKKIGATRIFWAAREIWARPVFKEVCMFFFFEEILDIFYFNLKLAW